MYGPFPTMYKVGAQFDITFSGLFQFAYQGTWICTWPQLSGKVRM